jgi:hypothetical protein
LRDGCGFRAAGLAGLAERRGQTVLGVWHTQVSAPLWQPGSS